MSDYFLLYNKIVHILTSYYVNVEFLFLNYQIEVTKYITFIRREEVDYEVVWLDVIEDLESVGLPYLTQSPYYTITHRLGRLAKEMRCWSVTDRLMCT